MIHIKPERQNDEMRSRFVLNLRHHRKLHTRALGSPPTLRSDGTNRNHTHSLTFSSSGASSITSRPEIRSLNKLFTLSRHSAGVPSKNSELSSRNASATYGDDDGDGDCASSARQFNFHTNDDRRRKTVVGDDRPNGPSLAAAGWAQAALM